MTTMMNLQVLCFCWLLNDAVRVETDRTIDECGAVGGMGTDGGYRKFSLRKRAPVPLCPP
jgi:hypothetical protein